MAYRNIQKFIVVASAIILGFSVLTLFFLSRDLVVVVTNKLEQNALEVRLISQYNDPMWVVDMLKPGEEKRIVLNNKKETDVWIEYYIEEEYTKDLIIGYVHHGMTGKYEYVIE